MPADAATAAVETVYRSDWGRIVATLIRLVGDFDLAEEAAQEAFMAAVDQWRVSGAPDSPRAWIIQTAKHKAIDRIRRQTSFAEKLQSYAVNELGPAFEDRARHFQDVREALGSKLQPRKRNYPEHLYSRRSRTAKLSRPCQLLVIIGARNPVF